MNTRVLLSLLVLLSFAACDSLTGPEDPVATLSGRVTTASTGGPYYPATVALINPTGSYEYVAVNQDGQYRFRDVRPGHYVIAVTLGQGAFARQGPSENIEIVPGANVRDIVAP